MTSYSTLSALVATSKASAVYIATGELFADGFRSLGMVADDIATGLDTSEQGYLKPLTSADTYGIVADPALSMHGNGFGDNNSRCRIAASVFPASGDRVKVKLSGPLSGGAMSFSSVWVGHAGSGANFDGSQVQLTFGGLLSGSIPPGSVLESDPVPYAFDKTKDLVVSIGHGSVSSVKYGDSQPGYTHFEKAASANLAGSTTTSGYASVSGRVVGVDLVSVRTSAASPAPLSVVSEEIPVAFRPCYVAGELRVVPIDALTLNTDIALDVSLDGVEWMAADLELAFQDGGVSVLRFAPVHVAGLPGDKPRWHLGGALGKKFKAYGIAMEFSR